MCASSHNQGRKGFRPAAGRVALRREHGMTTVGLIILVSFMGLFAFAALRLTPVYLNYMKITGVINGVFEEFDGRNPTRGAIRTSIMRRFDVDSVAQISARDVKVTAVDGGFEVRAQYDHVSPFISNVSFSVHFDKKVLVRR